MSKAVAQVQRFQKPSEEVSLCHGKLSLETKRTSCIAMCEHLISTTSLLSLAVCADIISRHGMCTYTHHCLMLFHQTHCQELSLFIIAMLSRTISQMELQLFELRLCVDACMCVSHLHDTLYLIVFLCPRDSVFICLSVF